MVLTFFILTFLMLNVDAHGQISQPRMRGCTTVYNPGTVQEYCPLYGDFGPQKVVGKANTQEETTYGDYDVCRNEPREEPYVTVTAGGTLDLKYHLQAPHPGDCSLYVSYDDDKISDGKKKFALIWQMKDCLCFPEGNGCSYYPAANQGTCPSGCPQFRTITATIPDWLPSGVAVFHHNWYATHPRESGAVAGYPTVELYTACFDATVVNTKKQVEVSQLRGLVTIPDSLPRFPAGYRGNRDPNGAMAFGELASFVELEPTQSPTATAVEQSPTAVGPNQNRTAVDLDNSGESSVKPFVYLSIGMIVFQILSLNM